MRAVKALLLACLLCLGTAAMADVYPLTPPPLLSIDNFGFTDTGLAGSVETITDTNGCESGCFAGLNLFAGYDNSFSIYGTDLSDLYLQGQLINGQIIGDSAGFLIQVTLDDNSKWSALESAFLGNSVTASSFGDLVALNINNFSQIGSGPSPDSNINGGKDCQQGAYGDLGPVRATPEPASLTLVLGGVAAGILRRKLANKK
jgi:hypothetical protein